MSKSSFLGIDLDADGLPILPEGLSDANYAAWRGCLGEIRASKKPDDAARHYQYASGYVQALRDGGVVDEVGYRQLHAQLVEEWRVWADRL